MVEYVSQWPPDAVERLWRYYAETQVPQDYFSFEVGLGILELVAASGLLPDGPLQHLDYGCGPGYLLDYSLDRGNTVVGVDSSAASLAEATRRLGERPGWRGAHLVEDVGSIEPGFDLVTCIETVEHLDDHTLGAVLADLRRLVGTSGVLMVTTPNEEDLGSNRSYCPFCDRAFHRVGHVRSFSASTLRTALERAGFAVDLAAATNLGGWQPEPNAPRRTWRRAVASRVRTAQIRAQDRTSGRAGVDRLDFRRRLAGGQHLVALARPKT